MQDCSLLDTEYDARLRKNILGGGEVICFHSDGVKVLMMRECSAN